jgi:DNA replication protein DnaC
MLETEFDKPPDKEIKCMLCEQPLTVTHHWIPVLNKWMHATYHDACVEQWERKNRSGKAAPWQRDIPERFRHFDITRVPVEDQKAAAEASDFGPDGQYKTLVLTGPPGSAKSRIMWNAIKGFFDVLGNNRWVDYYLFTDLMTEFDRNQISKLKMSKYAFVDDIGATESYGRERAQLQDAIRARVQKSQWTFLTIDDPSFDPGFEDLFRERAVVIYVKG